MERFSVSGPVGVVSGVQRTCDGPGLPVVLVHGVNGAAEQWSRVMDQLTGRTAIAVDLRGHGDSHPGGTYGAADYGADVAAAMDGLGIARAHVVGTSFGGGVCVTLAASRPAQVQSLTVIGGALSVADLVDADVVVGAMHELGSVPFFEEVAVTSFAPRTDEELIRDAVRFAVRNDPSTVERILRAAFSADVSDAAARVRAPALVLTGEHDQTCPPELGTALATALGTKCRVLPGRGHMAHLEDPVLIASLLNEQLSRTDSLDSARAH